MMAAAFSTHANACVAEFSEVTTTKNSLATLISFAFFLGYLLNSAKTGRLLNKVGYKKTLIRSMLVMQYFFCQSIERQEPLAVSKLHELL